MSKGKDIFKLIGGILALFISLIILVFTITMPSVKPIEYILSTPEAKILIENGIPEEVIRSYGGRNIGYFEMGYEIAPFVHGSEWKISFEETKTLGGLWRGENPKLVILEQIMDSLNSNICFSENEYEGWSRKKKWNSISTLEFSKVRPYMKVKLPEPNPNCIHSMVKARASMNLKYPVIVGVRQYKNKTKWLSRELSFFTISKDELSILQKLFPKYRMPWWPQRVLMIFFDLFIFVALGINLIIKYKKGKKFWS
jgi:hypothetical protein